MRAHMEVECRPASECLITACVVTLVRPLAGVRPSVTSETARVAKPLPATRVFTTVWPLSRVDPDVYMKGRALQQNRS